jgi:hypothetical protein
MEDITTENVTLTLHEAFEQLIRRRGWCKKFSSPAMAKQDKYSFRKGKKIPEERLRRYLRETGATRVQEEKWMLQGVPPASPRSRRKNDFGN